MASDAKEPDAALGAERLRMEADERREHAWRRWGPYLSERQWGTVREDYSADGSCWDYFPHDHARSRSYRWGEDGLLGWTDHKCRLSFALALWNGKDPILKERLFGLTGPEGNHGEDVKELYYYLDATPTFSYARALYKYPQTAFPYERLVRGNAERTRKQPELELADTGAFEAGRYFDVCVEYAKASPEDTLIRITCTNRGPDAAPLHVLPTLWQRNTWAWGQSSEGYGPKGRISRVGERILSEQASLGRYVLAYDRVGGSAPRLLFTDNETNAERLFGVPNRTPYVKDAFHRHVIEGETSVIHPEQVGTKAAAWYELSIPAGESVVLALRLSVEAEASDTPFGEDFDRMLAERRGEADAFYRNQRSSSLSEDERRIVRQADAGLLWSRQFYHYAVEQWLEGDPSQPTPPPERWLGRNNRWVDLYARDVISMPDKWEYPWFAAWDLAFHCVAMARIDPAFAKRQLIMLCREWYMHPSGQLPAYEFALDDVNPPVHAWAVWRVYQLSAGAGHGKDRRFLESAFQKCIVNFTWWVNREDVDGDNLFTGGFLGLDNIGVFDRSKPLPEGSQLEQADATAWMAFYCTTMLAMALELAYESPAYGDIASKFFEHFVGIARATNELGGTGLWNEEDGFYYDQVFLAGQSVPLRVRSMVGLIPLFAAETLDEIHLERLPLFRTRLEWFLENRPHLVQNLTCMHADASRRRRLLSIPTRERLERVLVHMLDERELLSPFGIRSLSKVHLEHPFELSFGGTHHEVHYAPGESDTNMFGGNSNWRGPIWIPLNYLLIEALKRHHHFYRETLTVECPTGSGVRMNLREVAEELERRLSRLFLRDASGERPCLGDDSFHARDPSSRDLLLFHEYFHADTGRGLGASHQTGWTSLAANIIERVAMTRTEREAMTADGKAAHGRDEPSR